MQDINETVRQNIKKFRLEQELSQEKLAFLADLNRAYIGLVEQGRKKIGISTLHKIATALKIDIRDFFDE